MSAAAAVQRAKTLHQSLLETPLSGEEKSALAREIAGLLFHAEVNGFVSNRARILSLRLKTHAHLLASAPPAPPEHRTTTLWADYQELESCTARF